MNLENLKRQSLYGGLKLELIRLLGIAKDKVVMRAYNEAAIKLEDATEILAEILEMEREDEKKREEINRA
jgi:hypothetical protein